MKHMLFAVVVLVLVLAAGWAPSDPATAAPATRTTTGRELVVTHQRGGTYELAVLDAEGQAMPLAKFESDGWQLIGVAVDGEGRQVGIFRQGW